ncbi:hypothetical protein E4U43_001432 [Claviceps pusilla]|uniref:chitinase n=1 Tax=Claviceps pusilla TaxID=123648 RepID=A0A9P7NA59_9HYPO|nr:hypothetical protein E4U43_001432 [Claviceps pusilla]
MALRTVTGDRIGENSSRIGGNGLNGPDGLLVLYYVQIQAQISPFIGVSETPIREGNMQNAQDSSSRIATGIGQNSYRQGSGPFAQQRLSHYCAGSKTDVIPVAFMNGISPPIVNFANAGDNCTAFPGNPYILSCPQIEADMKQCQTDHGKTIILSLGGATYNQGGWSTVDEAQDAAQLVWNMFGPVSENNNNNNNNNNNKVERPFGSAVVDGFDFDFESTTNHLPAFGAKLRSLMDAAAGIKTFYLAAAPQCPFPDDANGAALNAVAFDFLMIQFYNNWCGVSNFQPGASTQRAFNFREWDRWAKHTSLNKNVRLLLGIPAALGAGGGFVAGAQLEAAIKHSRQFSSCGGVMMWDVSQLYANKGFLEEVASDLGPATTTTTPLTSTTPMSTSTLATSLTLTVPTLTVPTLTSSSVSTSTTSRSLVPHWGQCGGKGWTGPTRCEPPYECVYGSEWWSMCTIPSSNVSRTNITQTTSSASTSVTSLVLRR